MTPVGCPPSESERTFCAKTKMPIILTVSSQRLCREGQGQTLALPQPKLGVQIADVSNLLGTALNKPEEVH